MLVACNCPAGFEPDNMTEPPAPTNTSIALPPLVAAFVEAMNSVDLEGLLATFAEDALVNDQLPTTGENPPSESGLSVISSMSD